MSGVIPKEKLTAYERWEMAAFDSPDTTSRRVVPSSVTNAPAEPPAPSVPLPTVAEIEQIRADAARSGYETGYEEGIAQAREEAGRIASLLDGIEQAVAQIEQRVADDLLALAVEIAGQVLRTALQVKPDLVLLAVREALALLPPNHERVMVLVNPADAALVRPQLGDQAQHGWRIIEDETIERGGCVVKAGASETDATLPTRWRRVLDAIGNKNDWIKDSP